MNLFLNFFNFFSNLGNFVMIPIVITLLGLLVRLKPLKAIESGMTIGIGLIALDLVLSLIWNNITPVTEVLVTKFNIHLTTIDIGWAAAAGLAFSTVVGTFIIPFILALNILLFLGKITKTLNIDIWNYWHYAFTGSVVYIISDNIWISFFAAGVHCLLSLLVADITAKRIQETLGIPDVTVTGGEVTATYPIVVLMNKIYDLFSKGKDSKQDSKLDIGSNKIFEMIMRPLFLGFIIGVIFGVLASYSITDTLQLAMQMSALMFLLPRAVKILMEGFLPLSNQTRQFMSRRFSQSGREVFIGLDAAILLGLPVAVSVGLLLIPITLLLSLVLPFNTTLPLADLSSIGYLVSIAAVMHSKDGKPRFLRTLITGVIIMCFVLPFSSAVAPMITQIAKNLAMEIPTGALQVTALEGNLFNFIIIQLLSLDWVIIGFILLVMISVISVIVAKRIQANELKKLTDKKENKQI